jgi:hypothetical protein
MMYYVDDSSLRKIRSVMTDLNHYHTMDFDKRRDLANTLDAVLHTMQQFPVDEPQMDEPK